MKKNCGAMVMRGIVTGVEDDGKCRVESIDQPGITTLPLHCTPDTAAATGSTVLYCEFADGDGAVLMVLR